MGADFDGTLPYPVSSMRIGKGQVLTDFGQVESTAYFLNSGVVEIGILSYQTLKTIDFFFAGEFVCAYTSFLTQQNYERAGLFEESATRKGFSD